MDKSLFSLYEIEAWKFFTSLLNYGCIEQIANNIIECESNSFDVKVVKIMLHGQEVHWYVDESVFLMNGFSSEDLSLDRKQIRVLRKAVKLFRSKEN